MRVSSAALFMGHGVSHVGRMGADCGSGPNVGLAYLTCPCGGHARCQSRRCLKLWGKQAPLRTSESRLAGEGHIAVTDQNRKRSIRCFPNPRPRHVASSPGVLRGEIRTPCLSVGSYLLAVVRACMHLPRGKLRVMTSPDITFGVDKVPASKEAVAKRNSAIWLKSGCANPPGPFADLRLVH